MHCFGDEFHAVAIESEDLDWRRNLDVPFSESSLSDSSAAALRAVLRGLGLRMGVFDLKETPEGEVVWLEVNPQGQFLFAEGLSGCPLTAAFASFLAREVRLTTSLNR